MGTSERKKRETEDLRQLILDVAESIFVTEGVAKVTMRRIAAEVDYAPTVLYRLFTNKNDLMDHLIERGYRGVRDLYDQVQGQKNLEPMEALEKIFEVYAQYALEHPNHYQMWFETGELRLENGELKMKHRRLEFVVFQTWLDHIKACKEMGHFSNRNSLEVFQILWARMHGLISLRIQHQGFPWMSVGLSLKGVLDLP